MADKEERENNGINPQLSDTFSNSLFYDNLIASTLNVPTTTNTTGVQDTTSSWNMPYGENPDYSLGYSTWNGYSSQNPDLGNSYADAYATSDHFTTPLLDYYRNSPLGSNSPFGLHMYDPQRQDSPPSSKTQDAPDFGPGSPNSSGLSPNYDFLTSASHGRDLYTDAFQQWCPSVTSPDSSASSTSSPTPFSGRAYNPFGTSDVYPIVESMKQSSMTATLPNPHADAPVETVGPSLPPKAPIKPEKSKPSYSDVAKNKLQTSMKTQIAMERESRKDDNDLKKPNPVPSSSSNGSGSLKGKKSKSRRHNSSSHKNKPLSMEPPAISPDSRYGLDTFDDPSSSLSDLKDKALHSSSGSSSRKGSCSSNGSSFSGGVEEIEKGNFETVPLNVYDIQGPGPGAGTKYDMQKGDILPKSSTSTNSASKSSSVTKPTEGSAKKTCHSKSTTKPNPTEKIFFDPKRIFNQEKKRETTPNNKNYIPNNQQKIKSEEDNVLNNGKSKSNLKSGSTRYINNDLRDSSKKQTNTETRNLSGKVFLDGKEETNRSNPAPQQRKKAENTNTNAKKTTSSQTSDDFLKPGKKVKKDKMRDTSYILGEWLLRLWEWLLWGSNTLLHLLWNLTKLTFSVSLLFIMVLWHFFVNYGSKAWNYVATKVPFLRRYASEHAGNTWYEGSNAAPKPRPCGLKENIPLPSTGDEAMKRLLSCRGKDPYSILGLKADATDDEIRKYYRRQAVLVHPDKNQQPGAEEAFKILGHAFEIIGDADKRRHYDNQRTEAQEIETAMNEFADLFTKFRSKMQEEANLMRCEHCGGKHKRVLTERPAYSARYCNRCSARHPAKEGDVWAESSVLGFLWHYYACMEGKVYDITEWASCQNESFKCMKANEHHVIYRISTGAGRNKNASTRTGGADFEDFLSNLFHHPGATPSGESAAGSFSQFTSGTTTTGQTGQNWSNVNSQAQGPGKKANRKRKGKKH